MEIQVSIRNVYGITKIYPANEAARNVAKIAGTKTLSLAMIDATKALGHTIRCAVDEQNDELVGYLMASK